ncbi:unnamed protein product [Phytophthora lilii]|uniref:Unnamed protein product n=1 Tax=Phytophthora lilii TaxID=2077276 RepID=A0A9W6WZD5_9STRA|nr:unnamed protein product [Phytophthora lilii]
MKLISRALTAAAWVAALLTLAPMTESRYVYGSAAGSSNRGGDQEAGAVQHAGHFALPPHRGYPHGPQGPVKWPHGHRSSPDKTLLRAEKDGDFALSPSVPRPEAEATRQE